MQLKGYSDFQVIEANQVNIIYQAVRNHDNQLVNIKTPAKDFPTSRQLSSISREYEILNKLDIECIPKTLDLILTQKSAMMVIENLHGISLKKAIKTSSINILQALGISLEVTKILGNIHRQSFCHRDISSNNILWHKQSDGVTVIDFGSALEFPHAARAIINPRFIEGTRAYMSPEQSGRINRGLDYRTDFYSLGVVLYELFTKQLPFTTQDSNELMHSHIALQPEPLTNIDPSIPQVLSDIVLKLMNKEAGERYQSAEGLRLDIEKCLEQYKAKGSVASFVLGENDLCDRFIISEKLYGRIEHVEKLLNVFEKVSGGKGHLAFIAGKSGVGKTSLVKELYKPLLGSDGYIVSGKFDQLLRHQPYSAIIQALSALIRQIMGESTDRVKGWKQKILKALGSSGQVLIELIPELELLIGQQPPVEKLSVEEECNRFNVVFLNLVSCFSKTKYPLVIFLDDLQWIDGPSLSLLEAMAPSLDDNAILIIGAYRSNEVSKIHPLMLSMPELKKATKNILSIELAELETDILVKLLQDTLSLPGNSIEELNQILFTKTRGNPLFFKAMLNTLYTDRHIFYDYDQKSWAWNKKTIEAMPYADNVVELLQSNMKVFPDATVALLKLGACIGNRFELNIVSDLADMSRSDTAKALLPAVSAGMILPLDDDFELLTVAQSDEMPGIYFKFSHDRLQQAAYDMISDEQRINLHWDIGTLILKEMDEGDSRDKLFDAVEHLNHGKVRAEKSEKLKLVKLNLEAGKKAKKAAAFSVAQNCLSHAGQMLEQDCWDADHKLTMDVYLELAQSCYLISEFDRADKLYEIIRENARDRKEKLTLCDIRAKQYHHQGLYQKAVDLEYEALALQGFVLPLDDEGLLEVFQKENDKIEKLMSQKDFDTLYNQNEADDSDLIHTHELCFDAFTDGYLLGRGPLLCAVSAISTRLSMEHGNCKLTSVGYICYANVLCSSGQYRTGHAIGSLAIRMADKYQVAALKNYTYHVFALGINHWLKPLNTSYNYWYEASKLSLESGSPYAGWVFLQLAHVLLASGAPIEEVEKQASESMRYLSATRLDDIAQLLRLIVIQPIKHLKGETNAFNTLDDENFSTAENLANYKDAPFFFGHIAYSILRASLLARDIQPREKLVPWFAIIEETAQAQIIQVDFILYGTLHLTCACTDLEGDIRESYMEDIEKNLERFKDWAQLCPENFNHKYLLIKAETARLSNDHLKAVDLYEQARDAALSSKFLLDAALADEFAGRFWDKLGKKRLAKPYLESASDIYERWGATGKTEQLMAEYPDLLKKQLKTMDIQSTVSTSIKTEEFSEILDLGSVIKASQAISQHMLLDKLADELLGLAIENAGATKGVLLLKENNEFVVIKQIDKTEKQMDKKGMGRPFSESCDLSPAIVNYVIYSGETIVFSKDSEDEQFARCDYIKKHEPKSICCVPIIRQKKAVGMLYLENSELSDVFKQERMKLLKVIASQSAISLENAKIYQELELMNQNLEGLVKERTKELHTTNEELNIKNRELAILSTTDQLTGLFNRRYIEEHAQIAIDRCERYDQKMALLMLDIDHFKSVNDNHGHDIGDEVIVKIANILKEGTRKVDIAGRWGGEEFIVLFQSDGSDAVAVAEKLRLMIMENDHEIAGNVTASFGVTQYNKNDTINMLVKRADQGLYLAKENGRNTVETVWT
jgi:diguanylate cyclase (GGDEF)-like protein